MRFTLTFLTLVLFLPLWAQKEKDDMVTDRPDQTESSVTITKGMLQIETGFLYQYGKDSLLDVQDYVYNSSLIRYGLMDNLELRFGFGYMAQKFTNDEIGFNNTNRAWTPMTFGMKTYLTEQKGIIPELSLLTTLLLNTAGDQVFGAEYTGIDIRLAASHKISEKFGLGYNFGAEWNGANAYPVYFYSISAGYSILDRLGFFTEVYGYLPEFYRPDHRIDAGFTFLIIKRLQFDLSAGKGLSETSPDYFIGTGLSWKFRP